MLSLDAMFIFCSAIHAKIGWTQSWFFYVHFVCIVVFLHYLQFVNFVRDDFLPRHGRQRTTRARKCEFRQRHRAQGSAPAAAASSAEGNVLADGELDLGRDGHGRCRRRRDARRARPYATTYGATRDFEAGAPGAQELGA